MHSTGKLRSKEHKGRPIATIETCHWHGKSPTTRRHSYDNRDNLANPVTTTTRSHHDNMSAQACPLSLLLWGMWAFLSYFWQGRHKGDENPTLMCWKRWKYRILIPMCQKTWKYRDPNANVSQDMKVWGSNPMLTHQKTWRCENWTQCRYVKRQVDDEWAVNRQWGEQWVGDEWEFSIVLCNS